ncbi:hypothetical protein REPUB_Repub05bG0046600 [Reevesia pubescens]
MASSELGSMGGLSETTYKYESQKEDLELPIFDFVTIARATNNFSPKNKIGEGGFGSVYKGILEDGQEIAVKRLSKSSRQGDNELLGYMSPEYAIDGVYSIKSDVFSFGVLLLEMISGKRNRGFSHPDHQLNLVGHVYYVCNKVQKTGQYFKCCVDAKFRRSIASA